MSITAQSGNRRSRPVLPLIVLLLCALGCNRPAVDPADQGSLKSAHPSPLQTATAPVTRDPDTAFAASENQLGGAENSLPPHGVPNLPAGTLLTVRLTSPVYADTSISSASFRGVVVEPVVVDGSTVIPGGANVVGVVESVRASKIKPNRGYVQLTLQSVQIGGSEIPVHTASLFARPALSQGSAPSLIRLEQGRQVTFRLSEPASGSEQQAQR